MPRLYYYKTVVKNIFLLSLIFFQTVDIKAQNKFGILAGAGKTSLNKLLATSDPFTGYSSRNSYWGGITAGFPLGTAGLSVSTSATYNKKGYDYNFKRGKISVYTVDQSTYFAGGFGSSGGVLPTSVTDAAANNLYEKAFRPADIFTGRSLATFNKDIPLNIIDFAYFPSERGAYNYNSNLDTDGYLSNPRQNFGAVMRGITADNDFENANTEYLTFWMLDPFKDIVRDGSPNGNKKNTTGGKLMFHLGNISEDYIPDSRNNFENGLLPNGGSSSQPVNTRWGKAPSIQFMTDAFDNQNGSREKQDVGLDGLNNSEETSYPHIQKYLSDVKTRVKPTVFNQISKDPSGDDFKFFIDPIIRLLLLCTSSNKYKPTDLRQR